MNSEAHKQIGEMIRKRRYEFAVSQLELAKKLGHKTSQFIHFIETGKSKTPLSTLSKIAVLLKLDIKKIEKLLVKEAADKIKAELKRGLQK